MFQLISVTQRLQEKVCNFDCVQKISKQQACKKIVFLCVILENWIQIMVGVQDIQILAKSIWCVQFYTKMCNIVLDTS